MNLKKIVLAGLIAVLGIALVHTSAFAQADKTAMQLRARSQAKQMFIDENGDGICDTRMDQGKMAQNGNHAGMMNNHDEMMKDHKSMMDGMTDGSMNGMTNNMMRHQMGTSGTGMTGGMGSMGKSGMHG